MTSAAIPPRIHVLAKPTGAMCNLHCSYCFFLNKERLYPGSRFRMSDEVLETYIRQLIECHQSHRVTVSWQGGEPTLMGIDFFRRAIGYQERYQKPGMVFENTLRAELHRRAFCLHHRPECFPHRPQQSGVPGCRPGPAG